MQTIELRVSGMTCGACVAHVSKALQNVSRVRSAVVDLASGAARVEGENLNTAVLIAAVEEEGYGASQAQNASLANSVPLTAIGCSCGD